MKIPKSLFLLGVASLLNDVASEAIYPLLAIYLTEVIGTSVLFIGILEGSAESVAALTKLLSGYLSDRGKNSKKLVLIGYSISSLLRPLIGLITVPWQAFVLRFGDRLGKGIRSAPRDAWLSHTVPEEKRAWMFSVHRAFDHTGAAIGPLLASLFLYFYPGNYRHLFLLTIIPGLLLLVAVVLAPEEKNNLPPTNHKASIRDLFSTSLNMPRSFHFFMISLLLFTLGQSSETFLLLKLRECGISITQIPLLWAALHVVKLSTATLGGRFADRFGRELSLIIGWIIFILTYVLLSQIQNPLMAVLVFLFYGLCFGFIEGPSKALVSKMVPKERGTAFGAYNLMQAIGALPAGAIAGLLWTKYSSTATLLFSGGCALLAIVIFLLSQTIQNKQKTY